MNRQSFLKLVENPSLLSEDTIVGLATIVADYPFFQAGRMLYVKNLSVLDSLKYNSALKSAAAFIENRDKLYELIHRKSFTVPDVIQAVGHEVSDEPIKIVETLESNVEKSEEIVSSTPITDYFEVSTELDLSGFSSKMSSQIAEKPVVAKVDEFVEIPAMNYPSVDLLDFEKGDDTGYLLENEVAPLVDEDALTFSDWLIKMRQNKATEIHAKSEKSEKMDIINNFLKNKPKRIIPKIVDVNEGERVPKKDFDEPEDLLTETLANIYIKQKHYEKSIKIFEKLRLKYPEKSIYFANRIDEVEKLSNNNL